MQIKGTICLKCIRIKIKTAFQTLSYIIFNNNSILILLVCTFLNINTLFIKLVYQQVKFILKTVEAHSFIRFIHFTIHPIFTSHINKTNSFKLNKFSLWCPLSDHLWTQFYTMKISPNSVIWLVCFITHLWLKKLK